jgi:hypothetical protein
VVGDGVQHVNDCWSIEQTAASSGYSFPQYVHRFMRVMLMDSAFRSPSDFMDPTLFRVQIIVQYRLCSGSGWEKEGSQVAISNLRFEISDFRLFPFLCLPAQRVAGGQVFQQPFLKRCSTLFLILFLANPVVEVALAFDSRILERVGPAAQLARAAFGAGFQI